MHQNMHKFRQFLKQYDNFNQDVDLENYFGLLNISYSL